MFIFTSTEWIVLTGMVALGTIACIFIFYLVDLLFKGCFKCCRSVCKKPNKLASTINVVQIREVKVFLVGDGAEENASKLPDSLKKPTPHCDVSNAN